MSFDSISVSFNAWNKSQWITNKTTLSIHDWYCWTRCFHRIWRNKRVACSSNITSHGLWHIIVVKRSWFAIIVPRSQRQWYRLSITNVKISRTKWKSYSGCVQNWMKELNTSSCLKFVNGKEENKWQWNTINTTRSVCSWIDWRRFFINHWNNHSLSSSRTGNISFWLGVLMFGLIPCQKTSVEISRIKWKLYRGFSRIKWHYRICHKENNVWLYIILNKLILLSKKENMR